MDPMEVESVELRAVGPVGLGSVDPVEVEVEPLDLRPIEVRPGSVESVEVRAVGPVGLKPKDPVEVRAGEVRVVGVGPGEVKSVELGPVDPVEVDPVELRAVGPVDVEPVDPVEVGPVELEPVKLEPVRVGRGEVGSVDPGSVDPVGVGPGEVEPVKLEPVRVGRGEVESVDPGYVDPGSVDPVEVGPREVESRGTGDGTDLDRLVAIMARLRGDEGCPWDAEQTHESLVRYLIEETAELVEAIETGDRDGMLEELGDVLYQVLFHADLAAATPGEGFDIEDVARATAAKMVGRHPHVFGDAEAADADAVVVVWEEQKRREKADRTSVLDGVPMGMPSLLLAEKLLGRAARVDVRVVAANTVPTDEDALGDELLAVVAASAARGLDPERALRGALRRLATRIRDAEAP